MSELDVRAWRGIVTSGDLVGYRVEVRRQRLPWSLYVLAMSTPDALDEPMVGFAVGRQKLSAHLRELAIEVTWEDGRGPLAPERDRAITSRRRRAPFVHSGDAQVSQRAA